MKAVEDEKRAKQDEEERVRAIARVAKAERESLKKEMRRRKKVLNCDIVSTAAVVCSIFSLLYFFFFFRFPPRLLLCFFRSLVGFCWSVSQLASHTGSY